MGGSVVDKRESKGHPMGSAAPPCPVSAGYRLLAPTLQFPVHQRGSLSMSDATHILNDRNIFKGMPQHLMPRGETR